MMFALGIYDKLTPGELTGANHIAGTGTIDGSGAVGPIGGIQQKMFGAHNAGAKYFLAPKDNCTEVAGNIPAGLKVFKVTTFEDALKAVSAIGNGEDLSTLPTCTTN
jgi:PDZ domain-containing protein